MAKRTQRTPKLSDSQRYQPVAGGIEAPAASNVPATADLSEEYRYVLTDLKKIGWLALLMLGLLVALAFVIV